jgi:hypothetical protein
MENQSSRDNPAESVWVKCAKCGGQNKRHSVVGEFKVPEYGEFGESTGTEFHQLIQCGGCECIKYYTYYETLDPRKDYQEVVKLRVGVYPDDPPETKRRKPGTAAEVLTDMKQNLVPPSVFKMYRETIQAFNHRVLTLAGVGLRAIVEAVCLDVGITDQVAFRLQAKINELANKGHLTPAQANFLTHHKDLGDGAAHRMETPTREELEDGLEIIEGLLNTIYVLPEKAKQMQHRRDKRKADSTS